MVEQVREMFPQLATQIIIHDLQDTRSVQATIENILDGRALVTEQLSFFDDYCQYFICLM